MPIIRAAKANENGDLQHAAFNFQDVTHKAQLYLEEIRAQAGQILAAAKTEAEQIRQSAAVQGKKDAEAQAEKNMHARVDQKLQTLLPALKQAIADLENERTAWRRRWEQSALHLACGIAKKLVRRELRQDPEISLAWIREAIELASGSAHVEIRLHPQDHAVLGEKARDLARQIQHDGPAEITADPRVTPGGCIVRSEFGEVDQQLETQLARIEEELS